MSIVSSYVGYGVASILRHHGYHVVGSTRSEGEENDSSTRRDQSVASQNSGPPQPKDGYENGVPNPNPLLAVGAKCYSSIYYCCGLCCFDISVRMPHSSCGALYLYFCNSSRKIKTDTEDIAPLVSQTVDVGDEAGTARLALLSDVVVLCLLEDVRGADAVLSAFQRRGGSEFGGPSHLLVLSTTMTWAKSKHPTMGTTAASSEMPSSSPSRSLSRPVSMMAAVDRRSTQGSGGGTAGGGLPRAASALSRSSPSRDSSRPLGTASSKNSGRASHASGWSRRRFQGTNREPAMTEADYLLRQPPIGYLEHKRLETAALQLQSSTLSTCIVGAGVPYGLGEGSLLLRVFRDAWQARGFPVAMPTCMSGDNYLALIHVVDLSVAVGNLLRPVESNSVPLPFPKPYILAVEGNGAQCTAKELTAALGRGFGGSGETQPMGEAELEDILIEEPGALSLLMNVRFSNDGGVLAGMVADGELLIWAVYTGITKIKKVPCSTYSSA